jgi:hypothetical protein
MSNTPKFKVGDRVVIVAKVNTPSRREVGTSFRIGQITDYSIWPDNRDPDGHGFFPDCLELEAVYNSPLYKALK